MRRIAAMTSGLALAAAIAGAGLAGETMLPSTTIPGEAQTVCVTDYNALAAELKTSYAEIPVSAGLGDDGNLLSVFASPHTGSWTMVTTRPEGTSCVVAVGKAWQVHPSALGPPA
jgi:hypothetical protein